MSARRTTLTKSLRSAWLCAVAVWVTTWSWHAFTEASARFVVPLLALGLVVGTLGGFGRWFRVPAPLILFAQFVVGGVVANLFVFGAPLPLGAAGRHAADVFRAAVDSANNYTPPVPASAPSMAPILIMAGLGCFLVLDFVAESWGKVAVAGLGLLAMYTVPVTLVGARPTWLLFCFVAAAYLCLLFVHENDQLDRWGRSMADARGVTDADYRKGLVLSSTAATVGSATLAFAIVLPWLIPTLHLGLGGIGPGEGPGDRVTVVNPMTDLRRDLRRGDNVPLIEVRTDDPAPSYLRISVLNRFLDDQWSSGNRQIPDSQLTRGELPPLPGVWPGLPRTAYHYDLRATDNFRSTWLPVGELSTSISARGDWRYDATSRDVIAGDAETNTAEQSWSYTGVQLDYDLASLISASPGTNAVPAELTTLPPDFPLVVTQTALEVTAKATSDFAKAVLLQDWFRENFRYSIERAPSGNGADALVTFLDPVRGRVGYCEQFASAMAAMARALGIPARVAVGFLNSHRTGPGTFTYSTHDLHAWPELYFPGSGWMRFEPTPPTRASAVPSYTVGQVQPPQPPTLPTGKASSEDPRHTRSASPTAGSTKAPGDGSSTQQHGVAWTTIGLGLLGVVLLVLLAVTPGWWRRRRTQRRVGAGDPELVWAELRDTCVDLGVPWSTGRSPRAIAARVAEHFGRPPTPDDVERPAHGARMNPEAMAALERVVDRIERVRYAAVPPSLDAEGLAADGEACLAALWGGASRARRRRARWLPVSLWRRTATPSAQQPDRSAASEELEVEA